MNRISQFNQFVLKKFNKFLKNHFNNSNFWYKSSSVSNYINSMTDLDSFNYNFITNVIKMYFKYIDDVFFNSSYRRNYCESKGFYKRTILTLFGEITYKRRYYYDKKHNDRFFFADLFLNLPKRKYFDSFVCAELCNESSSTSYAKAGVIVSQKIGKRINNKEDFTDMCNDFLELYPERSDVIESKRDYILNNWNERQFYQNHPYMKCSMKSHISHIFADLFTSRPKAYSKKGLIQLLKLRLLKVNNIDIKHKYFSFLEYTPSKSYKTILLL